MSFCEDKTNCIDIDSNGQSSFQFAPDSDIVCGEAGITYEGLITPKILGDPPCENLSSEELACNAICDTGDGLMMAPTACISAISGTITVPGLLASVPDGSNFVIAEVNYPRLENNTCLPGLLETQACYKIRVQDNGEIDFGVNPFINNVGQANYQNFNVEINPTSPLLGNYFAVSSCVTTCVQRDTAVPLVWDFRLQAINNSGNDTNVIFTEFELQYSQMLWAMEECS